ncbi:MAG: polysaccharide biosynthesis protein [Clostridiaceae bacterium]
MRKWVKLCLIIIDVGLVNLSFIMAMYIRFEFNMPKVYLEYYMDHAIIISFIYLSFFYIFRLYDSLWKFAGIDEFIVAVAGCISGGIAVMVYDMVFEIMIAKSVILIASIFITILVVGFRINFRLFRRLLIFADRHMKKGGLRVMIVGAGDGGSTVLKEIILSKGLNMVPVCFVDDSPNKAGMEKSGVRVLGKRQDIPRLVREKHIEQIIIAIPSLTGSSKAELINICRTTGCRIKIMPGIFELLNGNVSVKKMRDVEIEDLLGRDTVQLNDEGIQGYIKGKVVMITGGSGSIGSELARQVIRYGPEELIILDIYENTTYELERELKRLYPDLKLKVLIASIRDRRRLGNIFMTHKPQVVFHAAAHKHVPLMENSPGEAIKNNIIGTLNLVETADKNHVEKFVMISTDKAVNPTNVMGATKRVCEMIIQAMASVSKTEFAAVRFGNVLGSNGSVIPIFKKQIALGGPVTVTDKRITRFFMTIPEASQLVLQAGAFAKGGEIFILDMGDPVEIYELAKDLIKLSGFEPDKDIEIKITGLRPGEKLYEEILLSEEGLSFTAHDKIFVAKPLHHNIEFLKEKLEELKFLCEIGHKEEIKEKLGEIVPTYQWKPVQKEEEFIAK